MLVASVTYPEDGSFEVLGLACLACGVWGVWGGFGGFGGVWGWGFGDLKQLKVLRPISKPRRDVLSDKLGVSCQALFMS